MEGVSNYSDISTNSEPVKVKKSNNFMLTVILTLLFFIIGVVSTTLLYLFVPDVAKFVGVVKEVDDSRTGSEEMDEEDIKADDLKWVEYKDDRLGISFIIPDNFMVDTEEREKDENNPASYDLLISYVLNDSKGNYPAIKSILVNLSDRRVVYSYSEETSPLDSGDPKSFTVNGEEYAVEKAIIGEGGGGGWYKVSTYAIALNPSLHARLIANSSGFDPSMCYEQDNECMKLPAREYMTSKEQLDIGKKIIESLKYIK